MKKLVLIAACALGGCTALDGPNAHTILGAELPKFEGQPVDVAVKKLGFPNDERTIMGKKVYVWFTSRFGTNRRLTCEVRLIVDAKDVVRDFDWDGNNGACEYYAGLLTGR